MKRLLLLLGLVALLSVNVRADEIEDSINAALTAYKAGKTAEAAEHLKKADQLLAEKAGSGLMEALPKNIGEWSGGAFRNQALTGIGGGQALERNYRKGDKSDKNSLTATLSIVVGSPTLAQVSTFLSNPALGQLLGARQVAVGGQSAMYIAKEGLLQLVVDGKYLVAVRGKKCKESDLVELASGVKLEVIKALK